LKYSIRFNGSIGMQGDERMTSDPFASVQEFIQERMVEETLPSLAVAVACKGEILWQEAFGWADRERRVAATPHTLYSLASISKPCTTTGLMVLQEQGKLDLDRPINDYLGDAKLIARVGNAEDATVRRVANHTSGLGGHFQFFYADEPYRRPSMDETIRRYGNLVWAPGERYNYSNLGYGVLDYLIERLSGRRYADFMREEVFLPLGMTRSSVDVGPGLDPYQAIRYGADGLPYPHYDFDHPGGSAVYASAHDMVRFGLFHLKTHLSDQRAILSEGAIDAMQEPTGRIDEGAGYGFGWAIKEDDYGSRTVSHTGGMGGVSTSLRLFPAESLVITALANANSNLPHQLQHRIASALLPEYAARRAEKEARDREAQEKKQAESQHAEAVPGFAPEPGLIGEWRGQVHTYQQDLPLTLWFKETGDIHAKLGTQLKTLVDEVEFKDGCLIGKMMGDLGTEDTRRMSSYRLELCLTRRDNLLNGPLLAIYHIDGPTGGAPERRMRNGLSHWAQLERVP
jgi:CubicO group peptidase (beta-lactamase class C family)